MDQPTPPFWFLQRQAKSEPAGNNTLRVTAPNMKEAFVAIRSGEHGNWSAALRAEVEGPDLAVTEAEFPRPQEAWEAAFELYRNHLIT
jgi:hypothetical protein